MELDTPKFLSLSSSLRAARTEIALSHRKMLAASLQPVIHFLLQMETQNQSTNSYSLKRYSTHPKLRNKHRWHQHGSPLELGSMRGHP